MRTSPGESPAAGRTGRLTNRSLRGPGPGDVAPEAENSRVDAAGVEFGPHGHHHRNRHQEYQPGDEHGEAERGIVPATNDGPKPERQEQQPDGATQDEHDPAGPGCGGTADQPIGHRHSGCSLGTMHRRRERPGRGDSLERNNGNGDRRGRWLLVVRSAVIRSTATNSAVPGRAVLTGCPLRSGPTVGGRVCVRRGAAPGPAVGSGPAVGRACRWLRHGNLFIKAVSTRSWAVGCHERIPHRPRPHRLQGPSPPHRPRTLEEAARPRRPPCAPRLRGGSGPDGVPASLAVPVGHRARR